MVNMKIAVDFDGTLTRLDVQDFISDLMCKGVDVYVLTFRYDNANFHKYEGKYQPYDNIDLWEVVERLGLSRKVIFTNCNPKSEYLNMTGDFKLLLDDDYRVMSDLTHNSKVLPIQVNSPSYKKKIIKILGL